MTLYIFASDLWVRFPENEIFGLKVKILFLYVTTSPSLGIVLVLHSCQQSSKMPVLCSWVCANLIAK